MKQHESRSTRWPALLVGLFLFACSESGSSRKPVSPLQPDSPYPKFRGDERQSGRGFGEPRLSSDEPWVFPTGKGIFSSPIVAADGTIYVGSADQYFYALNPDGTLRWQYLTGQLIDSAALIDDRNLVYVGSGDEYLYAFHAATGEVAWKFHADPAAESLAFLSWWESNVAMGPDGTLYAPNDNFLLYAIDRDTQQVRWKYRTPDQSWSLPAIDTKFGTLYYGNNNLVASLGANTVALDAAGEKQWSASSNGSIAASPLLTEDEKVIVGGFDGYVRAYDQWSGEELWSFAARDHIYSSPAELPDGTIVQPAADGTIYGLDPQDGHQRWAFDTMEAIRSSPAVDPQGRIYVGSGEGRLFVLNPDGTLRFAKRLIEEERNDMNASPALGEKAIYIAGESGQIFSVPYDYCLRKSARADPSCTVGPGEDLPDAGVELYYTTQLGAPLATPPSEIGARDLLAFSLFVRESKDTLLALIDSADIQVTLTPASSFRAEVSGDRRFITITPLQSYQKDESGKLTIHIAGKYLVNPTRAGLKMAGGEIGGTFDKSFSFALKDQIEGFPTLQAPAAAGDQSTVWEMYRLATPMPTIMPSFNQIGFDSLHYLVGLVESQAADHFIAWVVEASLVGGQDRAEIIPDTKAMFPYDVRYQNGLLSMANEGGFGIVLNGFILVLDEFRVSARLGPGGKTEETPRLLVRSICGQLQFYGPFLQTLGMCNAQTDLMTVFGATLLRPHGPGTQQLPAGVGSVAFTPGSTSTVATLTGSSLKAQEHSFGILFINAANGKPLPLSYGMATQKKANAAGTIATVTLSYEPAKVPSGTQVRAYLMVDTYPAHKATFTIP